MLLKIKASSWDSTRNIMVRCMMNLTEVGDAITDSEH